MFKLNRTENAYLLKENASFQMLVLRVCFVYVKFREEWIHRNITDNIWRQEHLGKYC